MAAVYSIERQVRTLGSNQGRGKSEGGSTPSASAPQPGVGERRAQPEQVTEEVFEEARRRDPEGKQPWVTLVDGHEGQLGDIHAEIDRSGVEVTLILDFIRVLEYLSKAAWCFFAPGDEAAEA